MLNFVCFAQILSYTFLTQAQKVKMIKYTGLENNKSHYLVKISEFAIKYCQKLKAKFAFQNIRYY